MGSLLNWLLALLALTAFFTLLTFALGYLEDMFSTAFSSTPFEAYFNAAWSLLEPLRLVFSSSFYILLFASIIAILILSYLKGRGRW